MGTVVTLTREPETGETQPDAKGSVNFPGAPLAPTTELERRILDATLRLVARWGVAKTTMADVCAEAGCSRATVYRAFPGGKSDLFARLGRDELDRFFSHLTDAVDAAPTFEDALIDLVTEGALRLAHHDALQFLLVHEPGLVLPFLGFHQVDRLYSAIAKRIGPHLCRFSIAEKDAAWAAEWSTRVVLSFLFEPTATADRDRVVLAERLVRAFLLPALTPATATAPLATI